MVYRFFRPSLFILPILLASTLWGAAARAQDVNVSTAAEAAKIGAEFRSELIHDDHGLEKVDGYDPEATSTLHVTTARLKISGKLNPATEYKFRFNFLGEPLDYGYGTHDFGAVAFSIGKMKVLQGGWDQADDSFRDHVRGPVVKQYTFHKYEPMLALHLKAAGKVSLQILNDVTGKDAQWNTGAHPTFVLGWLGDLGTVAPIFAIGSYDNNKSRWIDVGVKTSAAGLKASLDVKLDSLVAKGTDADGETKELEDTATAFTAKVAYEMAGAATPWVYYSSYDRKQVEDDDLGLKDAEVNTIDNDPVKGNTYNFDDNGTALGVGVDITSLGKGWTPFLAAVSQSGAFPKDDVDVTESAAKSKLQLKLGVLGEF